MRAEPTRPYLVGRHISGCKSLQGGARPAAHVECVASGTGGGGWNLTPRKPSTDVTNYKLSLADRLCFCGLVIN